MQLVVRRWQEASYVIKLRDKKGFHYSQSTWEA